MRQNATNNTPEYPTSFDNFYGYGARAYNGTLEKSFTYTVNTSYEFGRYASISSSAQNDIYEVSFPLKSGSYNLALVYDKGSSRGIASVYFDDVLQGTIDCYAASLAAVNRTSYTLTVANSGTHTIKIKILSKNASSSGYVFNCSGIFIAPIQSQTALRINTGFTQSTEYVDSLGNRWMPDAYFSGGNWWDIEAQLGTTITVQNTSDQPLYKFERSLDSGSFSYAIPVATGTYTLKLHFCEHVKTAAGQRIGTVALNGSNLLANFDIFAEAGGQRKALIKTFSNLNLSSCTLAITNTLINAIELLKT